MGWYRHITLVLLAYAFLVAIRAHDKSHLPTSGSPEQADPPQPLLPLTTSEIRHLMARLFFPLPSHANGYIEGHVKYMNQCKQNKADKGGYDGRGLPPGLAVKGKKQNQTIVIYEPWAEQMKWLAEHAQAWDWDMGKLYREVAQMVFLFPEIPDEDRERYIIKTKMHHIPGIGYKPRRTQAIRDWLTKVGHICLVRAG